MEDKTSIFENMDLFNKHILSSSIKNENDNKKKPPNAMFAVYDGHCSSSLRFTLQNLGF